LDFIIPQSSYYRRNLAGSNTSKARSSRRTSADHATVQASQDDEQKLSIALLINACIAAAVHQR